MSEQRVTVWVQRFKDRAHLMLQWIDPDTGRRKSRSAQTARADLEYELSHGTYQEALDLFESLCNPRRLRAVSERTVSAFAAAMRKTPTRGRPGMLPSSIKVRLQYLHTALSWAVGQGLLPKCPTFPSVKVPEKLPQPVPVEAFERLVDKAPDQNMRAYLFTAWLAGLRLEEAYNLEWERTDRAPYLDLDANKVVLPAEIVKAGRDQWVPLDPALREVLLQLPRQGRKVFHFHSRKGGPLSLTALSDRVAALAKQARVKLTYHTLRKGFGCRYAGKVPAQVLQKLMRHSSIRTTMAYYVNVDDAVMEAVLGAERNTSRNTQGKPADAAERAKNVNPSQAGESGSSYHAR
jgi:integrase